MGRAVIVVESLRVSFSGIVAVNDVSFAVGQGQSFGIVGESGSGKSSVLRVLAGLTRDWQGRILFDGAELPRLRARGDFRRVQMVFQDPYGSLHPRQTIDRQLAEPLIVHDIGGIDARIRRALEEVALPWHLRFRYPHQLSGGQRQRIAIARALIAEPEALLLDEPTSALDVSVQAEILNLLADLQAARRLTYILVSHNLAVVAHLCATIGVMQGGELVETLGVEDLRAGRVAHPHTASLRERAAELEQDQIVWNRLAMPSI